MKAIKQNLKWAAKILSLLILLQSCTVYHASTASINEAISSNNKVKIDLPDNDSYKFMKLVRIDDEIYGVARKKSYASRELGDQIVDTNYEGKYNLIKLNDENLRDIYLKNKGASTALTIAIPVVIIGIIVIITASSLNTGVDMQWGKPN